MAALGKASIVAEGKRESFQEIIANFWKETFEFTCFTSRHGIFLFQYCHSEEEMKIDTERMRIRANILGDLGNFKAKCVTTVSILICPDVVSPQLKGPNDTEYGYHFRLVVSESRIMHDLKYGTRTIASAIFGKVPKSARIKRSLRNLATKLILLQNLVSY